GAEGYAESGDVIAGAFAITQDLLFGTGNFFSGHTGRADLLDSGNEQGADLIERTVLGHLGRHGHQAGIVFTSGTSASAHGLLGFYEGLVEAAGRLGAEDVGENLQSSVIGMRGGGNVVSKSDGTAVTHAAQDNLPLAVLRGFLGPGVVQDALGFW